MNRIKRSIISTAISLIMLLSVLAPAVQAVDWTGLVYTDAKKLDILYSSWDKIEAREDVLVKSKATHEQIMTQMYDYISSLDCVAEVVPESDQHFSFRYKSGLWSEYHHWKEQAPAATEEVIEKVADELENNKAIDFTGTINIGVYSPYYGSDSSMTQNYLEAARGMQEVIGPECQIESWYGFGYSWSTGNGNVVNFQNWDRYGVILVDSHGSANSSTNKSYIWCPNPGTYDQADITEGHLLYSGGDIGVSGSYIEKYCDLQNTFIYLGICEGMKVSGTADYLLEAGAGFVCGYSESVTFAYDGEMMPTICESLVTTSTVDPSRNMTAYEACQRAKTLHGQQDPYGHPPAVLRYAGNNDLLVALPIEIEGGITINDQNVQIYNNNTYQLTFTTEPANATMFTREWTSSNPEIISVDSQGIVTAHSAGSAVITLKATNREDMQEFTATATVTSLGHLSLTGISINPTSVEIFADGEPFIPEVVFTPENASNKNLTWHSSNENVATVDETGAIMAGLTGSAVITARAEDGNHVATINVSVVDFNYAAGSLGASLSFNNTSSYPWVIGRSPDNTLYVQSGNAGIDNTESTLRLEQQMEIGESLTFEYYVSSEVNYDDLVFRVNGTEKFSQNGTIPWRSYTYTATQNGNHLFEWSFEKDVSASSGNDCGRIRNVTYVSNNNVTVTFVDGHTNETISTASVPSGTVLTSFPQVPVHEGVDFLGWDYDGSPITADITITAQYGVATHVVSFYDNFNPENPVLLGTIEVEHGYVLTDADYPEMPEYEGYTGAWSVTGGAVVSDMTINANYTEITYTVTFVDGFDAENPVTISTLTVSQNYVLTEDDFPEMPVHEGFIGEWNYDGAAITGDITITAVYHTEAALTVTFVDGVTGEVIGTIKVEPETVVAEFPEVAEHEGFVFAGWDYDGTPVTEDITITAKYIAMADVNGDGNINTGDAVLVLRAIAGLDTLSEVQTLVADMNGDNNINTGDAVAILRKIAGLE